MLKLILEAELKNIGVACICLPFPNVSYVIFDEQIKPVMHSCFDRLALSEVAKQMRTLVNKLGGDNFGLVSVEIYQRLENIDRQSKQIDYICVGYCIL